MSQQTRPVLVYTCGRAPVELIEAAGYDPLPLPLPTPQPAPEPPQPSAHTRPSPPTRRAPRDDDPRPFLTTAPCLLVRDSCCYLASSPGATGGALIVTCCQQAARLVDALGNAPHAFKVFTASLPRKRDTAAVRWLAAELGGLFEALCEASPSAGDVAAALADAVAAWERAAAAYHRLANALPVLAAGAASAALRAIQAGGGGDAVAAALDRTRVDALVAASQGGGGAPRQPGVLLYAHARRPAALAQAVEEAGGRIVALDACLARRLAANGAAPAGPPLDAGGRRRRPAASPRRMLVNIARRTAAADCPATASSLRRARALRGLAGERGARLAVLAADPNCACAAYELPLVESVLRAAGVSAVMIEGAAEALDDRARHALAGAIEALR